MAERIKSAPREGEGKDVGVKVHEIVLSCEAFAASGAKLKC